MNKNSNRKKAKRDNGNGSVYKLKNREYYCAAVMHGKKADGKPNMVRFYGKTEQEAKAKLNAFLLNPTPLEQASNKPILACDFIEHWLKDYKYGKMKDSSFDRLECAYRINIKPHLKGLQLSQVKPKHIEKIQNTANDKGLAYASIKKLYEVLRPAFDTAVKKENLITENPFEQTTLLRQKDIKTKTKKKKIYSKNELEKFLNTIDNYYNDTSSVTYIFFPIFGMIAFTGLRAGEAMALTWDDLIEHEDGTFSILVDENLSRSAVRDENLELTGRRKSILEEPKTEAGNREIPLNDKALNAIEQIKETKKLYNIKSKFIFATHDNKPCTIGRLQKSLINLLKLAEIDKNYGIHSLRHLFATLLVYNGQNINDISELMGHEDSGFTNRVYVHSNDIRKRNAVNTLI
jgi:integrase